jgi:FtsH-binding integral membrane protein
VIVIPVKSLLKDFLYGLAVFAVAAFLAVTIYAALFLLEIDEKATVSQIYIMCSVLSLGVSFFFSWISKPRSKGEAGIKGFIWMAVSVFLLWAVVLPGFSNLTVLLGIPGFYVYMLGVFMGPVLYALVKHLK